MVKKLLKYELGALFRKLLPLFAIVLFTAVLNRVIQIFESDKTAYDVIFTSSCLLLGVMIFATLLGLLIIVLHRYYTNFFTNEGYLTMMLPVKPSTHLLVKILGAAIAGAAACLTIFVSLVIAMGLDLTSEIFKALNYIGRQLRSGFETPIWPYVLEFFLLILATVFKTLLLFYACFSLGQRAKKNRVALSVGLYFIYYFVVQIVMTIVVIVIALFGDEIIELIYHMVRDMRNAFFHLALWLGILWNVGFGLLYCLLSHNTLKKKLNLE